MTSIGDARLRSEARLGLLWLPIAWLVLAMALAAYYLWQAWSALNDYRLPEAAINLVRGEMIAAAVSLLGGFYTLALALRRSRLFPKAFTIWQVFNIAAIVGVLIYTTLQSDFITPLANYAISLGEILIGIICIAILHRSPRRHLAFASANASPASSALARAIYSLLAILVGGFAGFWIGIAIGAGIAEATNMSSFEGASGFFAFFIGLEGPRCSRAPFRDRVPNLPRMTRSRLDTRCIAKGDASKHAMRRYAYLDSSRPTREAARPRLQVPRCAHHVVQAPRRRH